MTKKIRMLVSTASGLKKMEGIATILHDYFERFDKDQLEIDLIAEGEVAPEARAAFEEAGVKLVEAPNRKGNLGEYLKFLKTKAADYDIFYINGSSALLAFDLRAVKSAGTPVRVVESHNTRTNHRVIDRLLRPWFYASYTDALACGTSAGKWLFGDRDFDLVHNGRSAAVYGYDEKKRKEMREKLGLKDSTLAIGNVGNLNPVKNQKDLIDAFAEVKKKEPDSHLFLIGAGMTEEALKKQVKDLNLEKDVTFTGKITNVPDYLQAMDIMALTSLHEGLPLVVVEWQMNGLPMLISSTITRECAFSDLVHFKPLEDGPKLWADKLILLGETAPDRAYASRHAIDLARENHFDIDENAHELQDKFIEMVNRHR